MTQSYTVHLPQFEGPFDLLLYFIERDELELSDTRRKLIFGLIGSRFIATITEVDQLVVDDVRFEFLKFVAHYVQG